MSDAEKRLREIWTAKGVPTQRQDELLQQITDAGKVGAYVGPFRITEKQLPLDLDEGRDDEPA